MRAPPQPASTSSVQTLKLVSVLAPKVLLSALARGADTVAAEVALARPGWRVVAPLPFSAALYLEDFDEAGAATLNGLLADPKVRSFVVDPMHKPARGATYSEAELSRTHGDGAPRRSRRRSGHASCRSRHADARGDF